VVPEGLQKQGRSTTIPGYFLKIDPGIEIMKPEIHPEYREVVFQDLSSDLVFKTRSTVQTKETIEWEDGKEYPLVKVEVSSKSHPFYTGKHKIMDSGGRVDRFKQRYGKGKK
jgi:large subunit ribosomal protein L31